MNKRLWQIKSVFLIQSEFTKNLFILLAITVLLFGLPSFLVEVYTYNRWDNSEYFTPIIRYLHSNLLHFQLSRINFQQHLGEPLPANMHGGVFYPVYTLAVAIFNLFQLPIDDLMGVIVALHFPIAILGIYSLLRELSARPLLAWIGAASALSATFVVGYGTEWCNMLPLYSWLPWGVLGLLWISDSQHKKWRRGTLCTALSIGAMGSVGHAQMALYAWVYLLLISICLSLFIGTTHKERIQIFSKMIPAWMSGLLLTAPTLLPVALYLPNTVRSGFFSLENFLECSATKLSLLSLFSPLISVENGFTTPAAFYQGAQTVPFLLAIFFIQKKTVSKRPESIQDFGPGLISSSHQKLNQKFIFAIFLPTLLFTLFGLGGNTFVYPLTYGIPIWSSLRWPNRILLFANFGIAICAFALSRNYIDLIGKYRKFFIGVCYFLCLGLTLTGISLSPSPLITKPAGILILLTGVSTFLILPWIDSRLMQHLFLAISASSCVACIAYSHDFGLKTYPSSDSGFSAERFGIDPNYRLLPLSRDFSLPGRKNEFGLFASATQEGYWSLTGQTSQMVPKTYMEMIPSAIDGIIESPILERLLPSHLLRSWNVRYFLVGKQDSFHLTQLQTDSSFRLLRELENVLVFETTKFLPRVFFAHVKHYTDPQEFIRSLFLNESSVDTVLIEKMSGIDYETNSYSEMNHVLSQEWDPSGKIEIKVEVPSSGFLVISALYLEDWSAQIDGQWAPIFRVNRSIMGVPVPAYAKTIRLSYQVKGLKIGIFASMIGLLFLVTVGLGFRLHPNRVVS